MAIINNNVQNVKFLRNQTPFESREAARTALENNKTQAADGTALLARYTKTDGQTTDVKTLVGFVAEVNSTKYVTIIDVEGGSDDVEKLRQEINAKLGTTFISSGNTVEANLTALSGGTFVPGTSSSADTSVEGAKAYAYDLLGTLDYEDTAVAGEYVSQVTQADGKIAVTRVELPSVTDTKVAKNVVVGVSEDKGTISVERGTISSSAETIVLTDNADGGVNFEVNIDNETIVQDENNNKLKVASAALTQYVGDEDTIHISAVDTTTNTKTISSPLTISATTPTEANVKEQYNLVGASGTTIGATIKIYKDSALLSVALLHADTTSTPQKLPTYDKATDTWTDIDATAQTQANQALCYAYEDVSGNTIVAAVPVGSFINEQEFASGITWDSTANKVRGVVDPASESFLTVGADGFKITGVSGLVESAIEDLDATVNNNANSGHVAVEIVETDGKLVSVTVTEDDIASADDIEELSAKTVTEIASSNASISATSSSTADGTVKYDIVTDADKIQMSGFSAENTTALSGIAESDSIATAFEKTNAVITENERVTAEALNNLNTRVDTVSGDVDTIKEQYISGVSVNGKAVTVANKVAPISITAATSAATPTSTEAIVVNTDNSGNITLGIANIDCGYYDGTQG